MHPAKQVRLVAPPLPHGHLAEHSRSIHHRAATTTTTTTITYHALRSKVLQVDRRLKRLLDLAQEVLVLGAVGGAGEVVSLGLEKVVGQLLRLRRVVVVAGRVRRRL